MIESHIQLSCKPRQLFTTVDSRIATNEDNDDDHHPLAYRAYNGSGIDVPSNVDIDWNDDERRAEIFV
jgi:hypothetical protein